ncbi:hypothetical protein QBC43DRAFT_321223 [Cladorrhinum sp. PSN259]|nr:hypothetical protein QBC43DRAFT_321223 [Cladorrhinum sp. PSN259]
MITERCTCSALFLALCAAASFSAAGREENGFIAVMESGVVDRWRGGLVGVVFSSLVVAVGSLAVRGLLIVTVGAG